MKWFKKHKILTVFSVIILLFIIISSSSGGGNKSNSNSNSSSKSSASKVPLVAKIGEAANDGKFEFIVTSVDCGKVSVGSSEFLTKTAQGQYCLLNVSVKNIGDQAQSLVSSNQYLLNASEQKYSADSIATIYNAPNGTSWYNDINPGNSVTGAIVFDIPKDQTPVTAELHDSAFSGGVKVNLQ